MNLDAIRQMRLDTPPDPLPEIPYVGRGPDTELLYRLEDRVLEAVKKAACEHARLFGHAEREFYTRSIPEALAATLESFQASHAQAAAIGYLVKKYGWTVSRGGVTYAPSDGLMTTIPETPDGEGEGPQG